MAAARWGKDRRSLPVRAVMDSTQPSATAGRQRRTATCGRPQDALPDPDAGGIVLGWLLKLGLILAVIVIVGYDLVAITYNKVATAEDAKSIARAAYDAKVLSRSTSAEATKSAQEQARAKGITLEKSDVVYAADGSIEVTVSRTVDTLVAHRIGPISDYSTAVEVYATSNGP